MNVVDRKAELNDSERVYDLIRRDIITGTLAPGSKLKVAELRTSYAFGAAPLREALARLVGDKLVAQQSQRGFRVRAMTPEEVVDLGNTRVLLECEAVKASMANSDDGWEADLVAAYHKLSLIEKRPKDQRDLIDLEDRNRAFHDALVARCPSEWLIELRAQIYAHHERYREASRQFSSGERDTPAEHAAIFEAALAGDVAKTCQEIKKHIDLTTVQAVEAMKRVP